MELSNRNFLLRAALAVTLLLSAAAIFNLGMRAYQAEMPLRSLRLVVVIVFVGLLVIGELLLLLGTFTRFNAAIWRGLDAGFRLLERLHRGNIAIYLLILVLLCFLTLGPLSNYFGGRYIRLLLYWLVVLSGSILLAASGLKRHWAELLAASLLFSSLGYRIAVYLPEVSAHPFSLGWSEASRFYYASLYFSRQIYDTAVAPTVLHPSRYLMQAVPFLIPDSPIWMHRLWQVVLWVGITLWTSYLLARHVDVREPLRRWMFIAWAFLFLLIGPVYYHLQVAAIIVLLGFDRKRFYKTLLAVLLASMWAGISRVNWFPVPGMLASALYLLEEPLESRSVWRYLAKPFAWSVLGVAAAFAAQAAYAFVSGNPTEHFTSSFSSDLLWYRLLPNPTYPTGVIPSALLVSLPLLLVILIKLSGRWRSFHPIRLLGLAGILLVLLAGGLVVSTKIGGGSNLHNLDAYLTLLLIIAPVFFFDRAVPEVSPAPLTPARPIHWSVLAFAILIPAYYALTSSNPVDAPTQNRIAKALTAIESASSAAISDNGEVLFLSERQLLTFHTVRDIPLIPDYEKVFLMEMAMAENPEYLGKFHQDLSSQKFALIVSEPLSTRYKGRAKSFGEENDAWVKNVSEAVLCYYEPFRTFRDLRIQLLKPRSEPGACPQFQGK
jgi:hypothetical protein